MSETKSIIIKGARVNNLKNIDVEIPRNRLVVITGLSGSGKSSLAFDTLYAEGQRRYVESLSSYARQFLGRMSKPECDFIKGIPPAIAIEQKVNSRNPRSTVGTSHRAHIQPRERTRGEEALRGGHRTHHARLSRWHPLHRLGAPPHPARTHPPGTTGYGPETRLHPPGGERHNGAH